MKGFQSKVREVNWPQFAEGAKRCELLIVTAGFEDRALNVLEELREVGIKKLAIIRYISGPSHNDTAFQAATQMACAFESVVILALDLNQPQLFEREISKIASSIAGLERGEIWIDLSALVVHGICMVLKGVRDVFRLSKIIVLYTEAQEYYPTKEEYLKYSTKLGGRGLERLPSTLTSETRESLILTSFSGFTIHQERTCLFLFAGYEKHRSLGAIESINPSKLVIVYGVPGRPSLRWRYDMSKELHQSLVNEIERAEEKVSTLEVDENVALLTRYYDMLYDNYSICIAPINSKMQTVACFLVWERFQDIQLCFPLPIEYLQERFSTGVGKVYSYTLPMPVGISVIYGGND